MWPAWSLQAGVPHLEAEGGKLDAPAASSGPTVGAAKEAASIRADCPVVSVNLAGQQAQALVDTGSEVSTVTETFYREHLGTLGLDQTNYLSLRAANGLEIP